MKPSAGSSQTLLRREKIPVRMNEDDATMRTHLAPLEEIADRHGIDPDAIRAAMAAGEIREHRQPGDPRVILAERDVLVWLAGRNRF